MVVFELKRQLGLESGMNVKIGDIMSIIKNSIFM
jgi:hypothetical protein